MNCTLCEWPIVSTDPGLGLPEALLGASSLIEELAPEVALLLPTVESVIDQLARFTLTPEQGIAAFLADPYLTASRLVREINRTGCRWLANLPSVAQHEASFRRLLDEVDLGHGREMHLLATARKQGFSTLATVCHPDDLDPALSTQPDAIVVLPPLPDFLDGFPPLARRESLEETIAAASDLPILGLRADDEPLGARIAVIRRPRMITR